MKDTIGCLKDLNDCISQSPSFIEAYYLRGKYHYEFGNNNLAIQDLNIYLLTNTNDAEAFVIRGECYARQDEFSIAISDYTKAISINDKNPTYYFDRGFFNLQLQAYENAQKDFIKAIAYDHQDIRLAYFNLGISSYRLGQKDEACGSYEARRSLLELEEQTEHPVYCGPTPSFDEAPIFCAGILHYKERSCRVF